MTLDKMNIGIMAALILVTGNVWAGQGTSAPTPGFDRVGTNVVGGMRGLAEERATLADASPPTDTEHVSPKQVAERKTELARRMFWIMMSMR